MSASRATDAGVRRFAATALIALQRLADEDEDEAAITSRDTAHLMPTRDDCLREAGIALLNAAIRIEQDRLRALRQNAEVLEEASVAVEPAESRYASADPRRLYSVAAVADLLGTSTDYVYDRINEGDISAVELGNGDRRKQRVSAPELDRFIASRTVR